MTSLIYLLVFLLIVAQALWLISRYYKTPGNALISAVENSAKMAWAHASVIVGALLAAAPSFWQHVGPILLQPDLVAQAKDWVAANVSLPAASMFGAVAGFGALVWRVTH